MTDLPHEGTKSFLGSTVTTLCGITVVTRRTKHRWWSNKPACPDCRAALKSRKKAAKKANR